MNKDKEFREAVEQIARSFDYMLEQKDNASTKIFNGILIQLNDDLGTVKINGKQYIIPQYGNFQHSVNTTVKVFVPQGNMNLAFFI